MRRDLLLLNPTAPTTEALFLLGPGQSVCFNSGTLSFTGNVAFGPAFAGRGCGAGNQETVDLSGVNGTNALLTANLGTPAWTNNLSPASVTSISTPAYPYCSINRNASVQFTLGDGSTITPGGVAYNHTYLCP
jgi:hypothetical protein